MADRTANLDDQAATAVAAPPAGPAPATGVTAVSRRDVPWQP